MFIVSLRQKLLSPFKSFMDDHVWSDRFVSAKSMRESPSACVRCDFPQFKESLSSVIITDSRIENQENQSGCCSRVQYYSTLSHMEAALW